VIPSWLYLSVQKNETIMEKRIIGIQQIGIGVKNMREAWSWYKKAFGMDIRVFEDDAVAALMLPYTGGEPRKRHAALAINIQGGGGFEIWQYKGRIPEPPAFSIQIGDLGIFAAKVKSKNVRNSFKELSDAGISIPGGLLTGPDGKEHFFVTDPYNNIFDVVEGSSWFHNDNKHSGGTYGAIIGVSNIDAAMKVYSDILGYDHAVYDKTGVFPDLSLINGGSGKFRRVLLTHSVKRSGGFSRLFGESKIELIQALDRQPESIFKNRLWGDLGFIHLCFDIQGMHELKKECAEKGFPFTVDSEVKSGESFDMGEAAGHFSYIEDCDGTLIEFVETHRVPILKKLGISINMTKRNPLKNLPDWLIKGMRFNRFKG
jgi:catechol 2,3-dioxygenase-like lactoylglutathione lyase family enzyme